MADTTAEQEMVDLYTQAEKNVLSGKSVTMNGRSFTYENISEIRAGRQEWELKLNKIIRGSRGPRVTRIIPVDF